VSQTDQTDLLDVYDRASGWTAVKVKGATRKLDRETPCDEWDVRSLLNHMLDTQRYFTGAARGEDASPPSPAPPNLLGDDPVATFEQSRSDLMRAFREPGAIEKTGPALGIACADQLLHGWDLAKATGQSTDLAPELAAQLLAGARMAIQPAFRSPEGTVFGPEQPAPAGACNADQLAAFLGRKV